MPPKAKKTYDIVQQGIEVLYNPDKPDVDIVAVPGLGAHPKDSWKSADSKFNWLFDKEGLPRDFSQSPKARVLLYLYESAWTGPLKVKQFLGNLATTLLHGLRIKREDCPRRPIVFIGHSMGGLVIAKAVCVAESRRDAFPCMFESIAGCLFFGTPFHGAPVAATAAMFAQVGEKIDQTTSSKLLDLMKPGDEGLSELRNDFMRLVGKLSQKIELFCFYEEQATDFAKLAGLPAVSGLFNLVIPKNLSEFVSRDSATLLGVDQMGLACTHRDLVKFDGFKDERYQLVRDPIKRIVRSAPLIVKNRFNSTRDIDRDLVKGVLDVLEGVQIQKKRRALAQSIPPSCWITKEQEFVGWLRQDDASEKQREDCLWIRGPEGRGKTSASIAAIDETEALIRAHEENNPGRAAALLAYFFCDSAPDCCTAEDVLKSLLRQLIYQQETLAAYAKQFVKKKGKEEPQFKLSVENLWQSLQNMLTDDLVGGVYFVVNNLHALPDDADSTVKLMELIHGELQSMNDDSKKRIPTRWLFTSREAHSIVESLKLNGVRLIDLEDPRYENQVQLELRRHAQKKVAALGSEKKYNKALAYFASSLIGKRAQNTQWIDITCVQLAELAENENDLKVRRVLKGVPQDLKALLDRAWLQVFNSNDDGAEKIKEMLRALVLVYEDPTDAELALLAGLSDSNEHRAEIRASVEMCKPLLTLKRSGKAEYTVSFMNMVVKRHLQENSRTLLGLSDEETKWQHGMIALRCFAHLTDRLSQPDPEKEEETTDGKGATDAEEPQAANDGAEGDDEEKGNENEDGEGQGDQDEEGENGEEHGEDWEDEEGYEEYEEVDEDSDWSEETPKEDVDSQPEEPKATKTLGYTVKHWLHHASKATLEIAEDLSLEEDFWKPDSDVRRRWLAEYNLLTNDFEDFDLSTLTALHVAASIGFTQLVASLMKHGHDKEKDQRDSLANTPLHFAAFFGRVNIVEELLNKGAKVDDGREEGEQTPLHMASFKGNIKVMTKLLRRGADPNAMGKEIGPVVNAAICSGNREAVKILVEKGVSLTHNDEDLPTPLTLAALLSDSAMFNYLVETCSEKLRPQDYDTALEAAAVAGRPDVLNTLLQYEHSTECLQNAIDNAADERNWDTVLVLLQHSHGLDCNKLFYSAAVGVEQQDRVLEAIWQYTNGDISEQTLNRSLYDATDKEKESTVQLLLEMFHADPNEATGDEYGNALTAAAYDGTENIVNMLLSARADVNSPNGWALQAAAAQGHAGVVKLLLDDGANVNVCISNDRFPPGTALQAACEAGRVDIVTLLLDHHADPDLGAGPLTCPIIAAARLGEEEILGHLIKAGARLDVFGGPDHSTPLINAAAMLPWASVQALLDAGADINLPDKDGDTALIVAAACGDDECVQQLLDRGADIMHANKAGCNALQTAFENENGDCVKLLIDGVSVLLGALKTAVGEGNMAVARVVRGAVEKPDSSENVTHEEGQDPGNATSPLEQQMIGPESPPPATHGGYYPQNAGWATQTACSPPARGENPSPSAPTSLGRRAAAFLAKVFDDEPGDETTLSLRPRHPVQSDSLPVQMYNHPQPLQQQQHQGVPPYQPYSQQLKGPLYQPYQQPQLPGFHYGAEAVGPQDRGGMYYPSSFQNENPVDYSGEWWNGR